MIDMLARGYHISPITKDDEIRNKKIAALALEIGKLEKVFGVNLLTRVFSVNTLNELTVAGILKNDS